jgi:hypothetical protein
MIQKYDRIAHFQQGKPPSETQLQVLCEDSSGTYVLPFNCFFRDGRWIGVGAGRPVEATVLGWRMPPPPSFKRGQ